MNYKEIIREKSHRLPRECYQGKVLVSFTACMTERAPFWTNEDRFTTVINTLQESFTFFQARPLVYCLMPDHLHIVAQGISESSDLWRAMVRFKQISSYWLHRNFTHARWQKDFHDRVIRDNRELTEQINYILANPVRAGLVEIWNKYPFTGPANILDYDVGTAYEPLPI